MTPSESPPSLERFRAVLASRLGLRFDDDRAELLSRLLEERAGVPGGRSVGAYLARLASGDAAELRVLAERLTVGETYFFRNTSDMEAFVADVVPQRMAARAAQRRLRILSAGCSTGEEAYTLAMLVRMSPALARWDVRVHGFDVNPGAVARAREARYSAWSLRQTRPDLQARFFRPQGRELRVVEDVAALVTIEERNLVDDDPAFWSAGAYDVIFCRNVLMYLEPAAVRRIVSRLAGALAPGGFLFLGHAETLRGVSTDFHLRQSRGTFYYQRRGRGDAPPLSPPDNGAGAAAPPALEHVAEHGWIAAIRESAERIAELARGGLEASAAPAAGGAAVAGAEAAPVAGREARVASGGVAGAIELMKRERFAEALAALGPAPEAREKDVDALLLRAVLLSTSGDTAGAEAVCARVLQLDELNAEAHYVRAICREHAGDPAAAADHDRYALYLDPTFAMPRLHLGLLAKRSGDLDSARRELSRALVLFAAEDGSRILLLGSGFTRDALVELCRSELAACGGRP